MSNNNMNKAKINRNDEFYTQLSDIKKELKHYKNHFKDKVIYCNTDNYEYSNFVKYFVDNFKELKLKKIISLDIGGNYFEYDGVTKQYSKFKDGDFRGEYSTQILRNVDIVVTNPPFSLFREYVEQLIEYEKEFLIIGNFNAVTYKEIFPLLKDEKMWLGYTTPKEFIQPDGTAKKFGNITWFTNLTVNRRNKPMKLYHTYEGNEDKYPKYDNYDIINVDRVNSIPGDYEGIMGVPITYLTKHSPKQFEVLGIANNARWIGYECVTTIGDRKVYNRILIKNKFPQE